MVVDHICVNYGAEFYQDLFLALQDRGIDQNVFYPRNRSHRIADPDRPYRIDSPRVLGALTKVSFSRKQRILRQQYDKLFHRNKPDLFHAHTLFSDGALANHYHKKYAIPFIVAIRSTDMDIFLKYKPWLLPLGKQIAGNASSIVFISPSLKRKFLRKFGDSYESKSLVLPNGINQSYFQDEVTVKKATHTPLELLYVGSFQKLKKVPVLIKLTVKAGARLTIVGDGGKDEKRVLQMIGNSNNIHYPGRINNPARLSEFYRQSDIFVMTSKRETLGLVYLEAMSQGLPIIYSRNAGIDGLFEEGTVGYGVRPGSETELKEAMGKILANYEEISGNCISWAKQFNWKRISEKYKELYFRC